MKAVLLAVNPPCSGSYGDRGPPFGRLHNHADLAYCFLFFFSRAGSFFFGIGERAP
jgi:hypothetical protein